MYDHQPSYAGHVHTHEGHVHHPHVHTHGREHVHIPHVHTHGGEHVHIPHHHHHYHPDADGDSSEADYAPSHAVPMRKGFTPKKGAVARPASAVARGRKGKGCKVCKEVTVDAEKAAVAASIAWGDAVRGQEMPRKGDYGVSQSRHQFMEGIGADVGEGGWEVRQAVERGGEWYSRVKALQRWLSVIPAKWPPGLLDEDDVHGFVRCWVSEI